MKYKANAVAERLLTLTQSEHLRIGERGEYILRHDKPKARAVRLGASCWVEKRPPTKEQKESDDALRWMIDVGPSYQLVYGFTWKGRDYDAGENPGPGYGAS